VSEGVCNSVRFLKLKMGETNRLVLDNTQHGPDQKGISLDLNRFPVAVTGAIPEGSTIGSPYSTVKLHADVGQTQSVDLQPTFTGNYTATCTVFLHQAGGDLQVVQKDLPFTLSN
jgi:hypothetical protein